ncbi:MAG: Asp-tRNA(Asn)/Glu-tRNA(Gln) amidotransferase subunit GatA [Cyanobacteria bacterium]|nr:Asp-tRNA(Asn)/Glu-tRNA(Gln) amidotransferase subunit GatA [Cyanobacteriota bacterium]
MAFQGALEIHRQIQEGKITAVSVLKQSLQAIAQQDLDIGAFLSVHGETALAEAAAVDAKVSAGETLPLLAGVPIAIKDNINVTGMPTTCASNILTGYISPYNATVIEKIKTAGLPIVGKTNLDEFAMGSSTENSALKVTRNPWNHHCVPGGSSGGSAAAVAGAMVPLSLGSDTGGSVRQPASLCGLVGMKPTYGLVSRYGLVAFGSSLDQISPFAGDVADAAALLQLIAGFDPLDSTTLKTETPDYLTTLEQLPSNLRIGVIQELNGEGMQPEVAENFAQMIELCQKQLGASIQTISMSGIQPAIAAYYIVATAEASSNLARFDGVRYGQRKKTTGDVHAMYRKTRAEGFGPEVTRRIMLGTFCLSSGYYDAYYGKAQRARALLRKQFQEAYGQVDLLICPTSPTTAFKIGEKASDPLSMYLSDIATIPVNLAGIPAISIPSGFDKSGLPMGLQILGPRLSENKIFQVARAIEQVTGYHHLLPPALAQTVAQ